MGEEPPLGGEERGKKERDGGEGAEPESRFDVCLEPVADRGERSRVRRLPGPPQKGRKSTIMGSFENEVDATSRYMSGERFAEIIRLYTPRQVVEQQRKRNSAGNKSEKGR